VTTTYFHCHNARLRDLLHCKEQQDEFEFRMLKDHLNRYVANHPALANYLAKNPQYDHSDVTFDA
jgi:siderophore synthetase component